MASISRRIFLQTCAVLGSAGALAPVDTLTWRDLQSAAQDRPLQTGSGILVLITLNGGNDGLNTLVPFKENAYYDGRPELAIAPEKVLPLDDQFGLNPEMRGFSKLFSESSLAVVRGVGYPEPDRSHFRSMDIWQSASLDNSVSTGWIGRWLDATKSDPLRALSIGPLIPRLAVGETTTAAALVTDVVPPSNMEKVSSPRSPCPTTKTAPPWRTSANRSVLPPRCRTHSDQCYRTRRPAGPISVTPACLCSSTRLRNV